MIKMYCSSNFFMTAYYPYSNHFQEAEKNSLPMKKSEPNVDAVFKNFLVFV
jgi:hypothetical protein